MKKHKFKSITICNVCGYIHTAKEAHWLKNIEKITESIKKHNENYPIKKLQPYRKYKVPSLNNKINEIIEFLNKKEMNQE